ncbi:MAG: IS3 family transposase, partial [Pseudomonadota bacterium]
SISGVRVARLLDDPVLRMRRPEEIILASGPDGTSKAMFDGSERTGVRRRVIAPGKPEQTAFVARFDATFRHKCLTLHGF